MNFIGAYRIWETTENYKCVEPHTSREPLTATIAIAARHCNIRAHKAIFIKLLRTAIKYEPHI